MRKEEVIVGRECVQTPDLTLNINKM